MTISAACSRSSPARWWLWTWGTQDAQFAWHTDDAGQEFVLAADDFPAAVSVEHVGHIGRLRRERDEMRHTLAFPAPAR
jgi:hypothetical protein